MWIYAPNKHANGIYATVRFVEGVGRTDDPKLVQWFRDRGYRVEEEEPRTKQPVKVELAKPTKKEQTAEAEEGAEKANSEPPAEQCFYGVPLTKLLLMNDSDLKALATANGLGKKVRAIKHREALLRALGVEM